MFTMVIFQVATAVYIIAVSKSPAEAIPESPALPNCTIYKGCVPPFNECDGITGACQITSRFSAYFPDSSIVNFWQRDKFNFRIYRDAYTYFKHTSIVCSEDGNYPSRDCRSFYQCVNGISSLKTCDLPGFAYFDPVLERCTSSSNCPVFRCFERYDVRVGLEGQLSPFFAYCFPPLDYYSSGNPETVLPSLSNVIYPYAVTRCYGKDILNTNTGRCEPWCLEDGLLPDTTDCIHYFLCSLEDPVNSVFTMARLSCPKGQAFLEEEDRCVPKERVSACTTPRAWPL